MSIPRLIHVGHRNLVAVIAAPLGPSVAANSGAFLFTRQIRHALEELIPCWNKMLGHRKSNKIYRRNLSILYVYLHIHFPSVCPHFYYGHVVQRLLSLHLVPVLFITKLVDFCFDSGGASTVNYHL